MISRIALLLVLAQSNAQVLKTYTSAQDHFGKGDYVETVRICAELVKQRKTTEGKIRARVGAGFDDKEFQPRRLAGDASMKLAANTTDLKGKLPHLDAALTWYKASADLKLGKSTALLAAAKKEKARVEAEIRRTSGAAMLRKKVDALRATVNEKLSAQSFEEADAALASAKKELGGEPAWKALKADADSAFAVWHNGLLAELRRDLASFKPSDVLADPSALSARFARYRVSPARAKATRLDSALGWAVRFSAAAGKKPLVVKDAEVLALEAVGYGTAHWKLSSGLVLETLAGKVKDPGAPAALEDRWKAVLGAESAFAGAAGRLRAAAEKTQAGAEGVRKADLGRWLREDLSSLERRVAVVRKGLPDRDAPKAVASALARLREPEILSEGRRDGYGAVETELKEILDRSRPDGSLRARLLAGMAVARSHALFLDGVPREQVLEKCRILIRDALKTDAKAFDAWKESLSPRVGWVIDSARR